MKKALFKIILPVCVLVLWMITCYPVCNKADGFDYFLYWILVGCPYGIRKMCMFLVPKNFGIAGSMGILALNCIVGGLIGGIIVLVRIKVNYIFDDVRDKIKDIAGKQCFELKLSAEISINDIVDSIVLHDKASTEEKSLAYKLRDSSGISIMETDFDKLANGFRLI